MKLYLKRSEFISTGIFGRLEREDGSHQCFTLEHAYSIKAEHGIAETYAPVLPAGEYICIKGKHKLKHGDEFETFEITGVKGHTGILFHTGNTNKDSSGCVLVGTGRNKSSEGKPIGILCSRLAFKALMESMGEITEFTLIVS